MSEILLLLGILILGFYMLISYVVAHKFERIAKIKGYGRETNAFLMCFFFGIIGCMYVIALPDLKLRKQQEKMIALIENLESKEKYE